jgi:hypothetical protein
MVLVSLVVFMVEEMVLVSLFVFMVKGPRKFKAKIFKQA